MLKYQTGEELTVGTVAREQIHLATAFLDMNISQAWLQISNCSKRSQNSWKAARQLPPEHDLGWYTTDDWVTLTSLAKKILWVLLPDTDTSQLFRITEWTSKWGASAPEHQGVWEHKLLSFPPLICDLTHVCGRHLETLWADLSPLKHLSALLRLFRTQLCWYQAQLKQGRAVWLRKTTLPREHPEAKITPNHSADAQRILPSKDWSWSV